MCSNRCPAGCAGRTGVSRREFLAASALAAGACLVKGCAAGAGGGGAGRGTTALTAATGNAAPATAAASGPFHFGPGMKYRPTIQAAFIRRKGEYGLRWPGQVYDGEAARKLYTRKIQDAARDLRATVNLRAEPIYSLAEADAWIAQAKQAGADGLLVVLLDRQDHAWPAANKAIDSGIATIVYSPVGTSFTTNTEGPSRKSGGVIYSTDDFSQVVCGMKMLAAGARIKRTRVVVIQGNQRHESLYPQLGIQLQHVPASAFLDAYASTPENAEMLALADGYIRGARRMAGATRQDVINGARSYVVARKILQQEQADGITMDCLGVLGPTQMSLPCLAWSRMNDDAIPAACEADLGAVASHVIVQYLFDRPGFQQDPVPETARQAIIGAHCSCPTRLDGFDKPPAPYVLRHHHAERDATAQPTWRIGQEVTSLDVQPLPAAPKAAGAKGAASAGRAGAAATKPSTPADAAKSAPPRQELLVSSGRVIENVQVPPAGGCVISVMVRFDNVEDVLTWPGFHQVFFYGNHKRELLDFCRLFDLVGRAV